MDAVQAPSRPQRSRSRRRREVIFGQLAVPQESRAEQRGCGTRFLRPEHKGTPMNAIRTIGFSLLVLLTGLIHPPTPAAAQPRADLPMTTPEINTRNKLNAWTV